MVTHCVVLEITDIERTVTLPSHPRYDRKLLTFAVL